VKTDIQKLTDRVEQLELQVRDLSDAVSQFMTPGGKPILRKSNSSAWMTVEEAAEDMRRSKRFVQKLCKSGDIQAKQEGKRYLIRRKSYEAYMEGVPDVC